MWTDYQYAAVYTCDEVLDDDHCAPNKDYIDVLSRDLDPIPVTVIERLKRVLKQACYEPGDLVESDHNSKNNGFLSFCVAMYNNTETGKE